MEFLCKRCGHVSTTKGNLIQHLKKSKECPATNTEITREELISNIVRVSSKAKIYECDFCNNKFSTPQGKSQHKKICPNHPCKAMYNKVKALEDNINELQAQIRGLPDKSQTEKIIQKLKEENDRLSAKLHILQSKKNEDFYQDILEKYFKATHKKLAIGITDITTEDTHIEIKRWSCWREAFAQLILYNSFDPKEKLHACFFGEYAQPAKALAIASLKQQNILCFELQNTQDAIHMVNLEDQSKQVVWGVAIEEEA
jgi:hypothetical protein